MAKQVKRPQNLMGDRRDHWNCACNGITGFRVMQNSKFKKRDEKLFFSPSKPFNIS